MSAESSYFLPSVSGSVAFQAKHATHTYLSTRSVGHRTHNLAAGRSEREQAKEQRKRAHGERRVLSLDDGVPPRRVFGSKAAAPATHAGRCVDTDDDADGDGEWLDGRGGGR